MASITTFQYKQTISINRDRFTEMIVFNEDLTKKDIRVYMHLLTHLDATTYKQISKKQIANDLNLNKSDVTNAIESLILYDIIEPGSTGSVMNGFRFKF